MKHTTEFYGCVRRLDVKQALEALLSELYFNMEFERDNGGNSYSIDDNDTYNADAQYRFCVDSRLCHIQIGASNKVGLRSLAQAFAGLAEEYFEYWFCIADTAGSEHGQRSFKNMHEMENLLRAYVFKRLVVTHGRDWEAHVGLHASKMARARKWQSKAAIAQTGEYVPKLNTLFYLDFQDVIQILKKATDDGHPPGELFAQTLIRQYADGLDDLRRIRNDMAHNRFLSEAEYQRVNRVAAQAREALQQDTKSLLSL